MAREFSPTQHRGEHQQRLTELLMAISLATDLGAGQPMGHALRTCYYSTVMAEELRCTPDEIRSVLQVSLLRFLGCTSTAPETAAMTGGDERAFNAAMAPALMGSDREQLGTLIGSVGTGHSRLARFRLIAGVLADPGGGARTLFTHCEVAAMLSRRLGLEKSVLTALSHGYERWDGKGHPDGLRGDEIPMEVRLAVVARDADVFASLGEDPVECLRARAGDAYDPLAVEIFTRIGSAAKAAYDSGDGWKAVLDCEPEPCVLVSNTRIDEVLRVLADFADLKSPWTRGHSPGVADLAMEAGERIGFDDEESCRLRRAGLVHDVGRVGVENGIWDKPGPLSIEEWERVRLHPYLTHRVLSRCGTLSPLADLAASHHERLDGSGYHRACVGDQLSMPARVLAAADVFSALCADRPHRPAMSHEAAADVLTGEASDGRLDADAVAAVLAAAGVKGNVSRRQWPAELTDREVEVLKLISTGWTNRQIADHLYISPKTVGHHVEHIYAKIGVSTRAGAAVFAMEHRLLG